jgi:hypothetical protein
LGSRFSGKQERLIGEHASRGVSLQDLEVLGPVDACRARRPWILIDA